jgi:uncharacterized membrane protein (UPF0127 family)
MTHRMIGLLAVAAIFASAAAFAQAELTPLTIESEGASHTFNVEVADEPEEIRTGLMFREDLAPDAGMIFDFGQPRQASMWMKNTLIPLDMLFFTETGEIIMIGRNTVPGSLRTVGPGIPVKGVLEIAGGRAAELGIEPGDTLRHAILGTAAE